MTRQRRDKERPQFDTFELGERVVIKNPDSWRDGELGTVTSIRNSHFGNSDPVFYYAVQFPGGLAHSYWPFHLKRIKDQLEFPFMEVGDGREKTPVV